RLVSAGCTMVLLEVIVPAGFFVPAVKWEGEEMPLTPPMLAIAAAGDDAANEDNAAADEAAGSAAEAHPVPHFIGFYLSQQKREHDQQKHNQ
ncbi:hypothetical protein Tco_1127847, partial [Tanacetum coccineum]